MHGKEKILRVCNGLLEQKVQEVLTKYALEKKVWWKPIAAQENQITVYGRKAFSWISTLQQRVSYDPAQL